jgi:oxygen-independent coproporphyrinogen-3 oxidase
VSDPFFTGGITAPEASIYLHIPFCRAKCDYCDFYSLPAAPDDPRLDRSVDRLIVDLETQVRCFGVTDVPTIYIGGGSPSLLGAARLSRLLAALTGGGALWRHKSAELTVEANPETMDEPFLRACSDGGVSRISVGIQTFDGESRALLGRRGDMAGGLGDRLRLLADVYGDSFSADLMTGLPLQTERQLRRDIETLLAYAPGHISLYALSVEPGTPLEKRVRRGLSLPSQDEADRLWILARDALEASGYRQYEVSNFSRPGKRSLHNIRYWRMENWLGLGPAASGTVIGRPGVRHSASDTRAGEELCGWRFTWGRDLSAYLEGKTAQEAEYLDSLTLIKETLLMGFRFIDGPDPLLFRHRFGRTLAACIPQTLHRWRERGLLQAEKAALTREGLLLLNPFLIEAFEELGTR